MSHRGPVWTPAVRLDYVAHFKGQGRFGSRFRRPPDGVPHPSHLGEGCDAQKFDANCLFLPPFAKSAKDGAPTAAG